MALLPTVTAETLEAFKQEYIQKGNEQLIEETLLRLVKKNPRVALFLVNILKDHPDTQGILIAAGGSAVYRLLEQSGRLPRVKKEVCYPIEQALLEQKKSYLDGIMRRIIAENPYVAYCLDSFARTAHSEEGGEEKWMSIINAGLLVYEFLRNQAEADQLLSEIKL